MWSKDKTDFKDVISEAHGVREQLSSDGQDGGGFSRPGWAIEQEMRKLIGGNKLLNFFFHVNGVSTREWHCQGETRNKTD